MPATKKCPWCAEEILAEAKKCKHCGEFLASDSREVGAQTPARSVFASAPPAPRLKCDHCSEVFESERARYLHTENTHVYKGLIGNTPVTRAPGKPVSRAAGAQMICPHCNRKGTVSTKRKMAKQGISGGKATGAVLTGGLSLFATGLSRKVPVTEAHCSGCGVTWTIV